MTTDELKRIYAEILQVHPKGQCLAWLAFNTENITTPIAIYDAVYGGAMMKTNSGYVFSGMGASIDSTKKSFGFLQELIYESKFYNENRKFLSKSGYAFSLNTDHLKTEVKKKNAFSRMLNVENIQGNFLYLLVV